MRTGRRDWLWAVTFIIIAAVGVVVLVTVLTASSEPEVDEPDIAGIPCERTEHIDDYHVHPNLFIYIEGEPFPVANNIGIVATPDGSRAECLYWLHTHNASDGTIHVEAPRQDTYTLGQLFAIWGQPLSSTQLLDRTTDAQHSIRATVDGQPFTGDPSSIELADKAVIILEFGPPFREA